VPDKGRESVVHKTILISIKPWFARAILGGRKRFELRRFVPRFARGDLLLIYASSPEQRVLGSCLVGRVASGSPAQVWKAIDKEASGIEPGGFFAYLGDCTRCAAIEVLDPRALDPPLPLPFRAPQSYLFLRADDPDHRDLLERVQEASQEKL
jgi:predicted transcriptional regulator